MPQLDPALVRERAARLRAVGAAALNGELKRRVGSDSEVLIERPGIGRAGFYASVACPETLPAGAIARMRFTAASGRQLVGVPLS
jgi:threonylcarbamoyladenosine tRNA methylthiotransferase MtaB